MHFVDANDYSFREQIQHDMGNGNVERVSRVELKRVIVLEMLRLNCRKRNLSGQRAGEREMTMSTYNKSNGPRVSRDFCLPETGCSSNHRGKLMRA